MRIILTVALLLLAVNPAMRGMDRAVVPTSHWECSVVKIEVTCKQFEYYQPWNQSTKQVEKTGIVTGRHEIVTTAEHLSNQTLLRLQKNGRGQWWIGRVVWADYPANLALLTVDDDAFWNQLKAVEINGEMPADGSLQSVRWDDGVLETHKATFIRFSALEGQISGVDCVEFTANVEMQGGGWGEPLMAGSHVAGIAAAQDDNVCTVIPAAFIKSVLEAHAGGCRGLGYFHFLWQPAENTASLEHLGLKGAPRGVLVIRVPEMPDGSDPVLKPGDVILQIDGFDIDVQGDYDDPQFGHLMLESLATWHKWAGDKVPMKILRAGREMSVTYRLPKYEYTNWQVPAHSFDGEPEYYIVGGLVFQPLSCDYLREWGKDWKRTSPFRLNFYTADLASKEQPSLVLLSQILPDRYNIGYQDEKYLVVDKINGRSITRITDLPAAFQNPVDGYHVIEFKKGRDLQRMVLAAGDPEHEATRRVLEEYGIANEFRFAPAKPAAVTPVTPKSGR